MEQNRGPRNKITYTYSNDLQKVPFTTTWMDLGIIILSEVSQT